MLEEISDYLKEYISVYQGYMAQGHPSEDILRIMTSEHPEYTWEPHLSEMIEIILKQDEIAKCHETQFLTCIAERDVRIRELEGAAADNAAECDMALNHIQLLERALKEFPNSSDPRYGKPIVSGITGKVRSEGLTLDNDKYVRACKDYYYRTVLPLLGEINAD